MDLEHRHFERRDAGGDSMRTAVGGPNGWTAILQLFAEAAGQTAGPGVSRAMRVSG